MYTSITLPISTHPLLSQHVHIHCSPNMYTSITLPISTHPLLSQYVHIHCFNHCFTKTNRFVRRDRRPVRCASLLNLNTRYFLMESTICLKCDISLVTTGLEYKVSLLVFECCYCITNVACGIIIISD